MIKNIILSQLTVSNYPFAFELWKSTPGVGLSEADSLVPMERFLKQNDRFCFMAMNGENLVGTILAGHDFRRGYLYHVVVAPSERHQGVARSLVRLSLDALQADGIDKVHCMVFSNNSTGRSFWEKIGFTYREDLAVFSYSLTK